ncbi:Signal transduction histidine kinase, dimerisation/phosphoacceptor domain [Flavobacteriaceae bacterium]
MDAINKNEMIKTNEKLIIQNQQIEKRVAKLIIDNQKIISQNDENEKQITRLKNINKELIFHYQANKKCNEELTITHNELLSKNKENKKLSELVSKSNEKLKKVQETQKEYIEGLESILFMTSHRIRQPIANILGLSYLLNDSKNSKEEIKVFIEFIKQSSLILDVYTQELSSYTFDLKKKLYEKNKKL